MKRMALGLGLVLLLGVGKLQAAENPDGPTERPAGSGVIVHSEGYVLTAHHVVAEARRIVVVTSGEFRAPASVVSEDLEHDLALLKMETVGLSEAPIGYAVTARFDQEVIVAGFPFGLREVAVTRGRIVAVRTKGVRHVFQIDAATNPGNSGGAVFNRLGEVLGVLTTKFSHPSGIAPEGMTFAVPISYATPLLANIPEFDFSLIGRGRREPLRLIEDEELARELARFSVRIETVRGPRPPSPAAPAEPAAARSKAEAAQPAITKPPPANGRDSVPGASKEAGAVPKGNQPVLVAQQEELAALAQRGITPPNGMVLIPAGEFLMGSENGPQDERPAHRTALGSFWIDKYELTNAEYRQCVQSGVCSPPKDRTAFDEPAKATHPVTSVTWKQAHQYCQWRGRRLPTEAEWEKAARGIDGRRYPWGNDEEIIKTWMKDHPAKTGNNGTVAVGSFSDAASPYGVFDLVGSVWEWVKDRYAEDYYSVAPFQDPQGPLSGAFRVLRGGPMSQTPLELRASYRGWDEMTYWGPTLGFRCAVDVP